MKKKYKKNNSTLLMLITIIFISNLSQIPIFHGNTIIKGINIFLWLILLINLVLNFTDKISLKKIMIFLFLLLFFDILMIFLQLFKEIPYLKSNFIYPVHLSFFILVVGYFTGQVFSPNKIYLLVNSYFLSSLIVAINIYIEFFKGIDWAGSSGYLYASKNSIAQIILISMVLLIIYSESGFKTSIKIVSILFFGVFLLMLKSRATLLGLLIFVIYYVFIYIKSNKNKCYILLGLMILIGIIIVNEDVYNFIINQILLNNRAGSDLDTLSSGRMTHLQIFIDNFWNSPWIGNGGQYLESFPLAVLISYGFLGGGLLLVFSIMPCIMAAFEKNEALLNMKTIVILLSFIMLANGIFEELSPYGPGVKCYALWMFTGLFLGMQEVIKKRRI